MSHSDSQRAASTVSSRDRKSAVEPVDPEEVLAGVAALTVSTWEYDARPGVTHMGPMAEEFHDVFGLGADERRIGSIDVDGVALAAIQGLAGRIEAANERIDALETTVERRDERVDALESRLARLERRVGEVDGADDTTTNGDNR